MLKMINSFKNIIYKTYVEITSQKSHYVNLMALIIPKDLFHFIRMLMILL
jgi:hypothetical protein